jgi:hypothetical protein
MKYFSIGDYEFNKPFPDSRCDSCYHFRELGSGREYQYQCTASTGCKAAQLGQGKAYKGNCEEYTPPEKPILDHKPAPKLVTLLITGLILSVAYALAIIIYGKVKTGLEINTPLILTFVTGIPIGTAAFTLLRLLKNLINKGATAVGQAGKMGGRLFGWLVATLLPFAAPVIAFFIMAGVFGAKLL